MGLKHRDWSAGELEILQQLAGRDILTEVQKKYNNRILKSNREKGTDYPNRSIDAVERKLVELTGTSKPHVKKWYLPDLARLLGLPPHLLHQWRSRGRLNAKKKGDRILVRQTDVIQSAKDNPLLYARCIREGLEEVIGEKLADEICRLQPRRQFIRIVAPDGKIYSSMREASRKHRPKLSPSTIRYHINTTKTWRTIEEYNEGRSNITGYALLTVYKLTYSDLSIEEFKAQSIQEHHVRIQCKGGCFQRLRRDCNAHFYGTKEEVLEKAKAIVDERNEQWNKLKQSLK